MNAKCETADYMLLLLTVGLAALERPLLVLRVVMPYVILLALFGGFVAWNGGVVLGMSTNKSRCPAI